MNPKNQITPNEFKRFFPRAAERVARANQAGNQELHPPKREQPKRGSLDSSVQGKDKSLPRFAILFEIYAVRPNDWDNCATKGLQDALRNAGILHDDAWNVLQGGRISKKAHKESEEKTEITITQL